MSSYTGILPLYKPKGMTSHDCIYRLRKLLRYKKIGHTGTLDPEVDGVLPICLGRATKVSEYLLNYPKSYRGKIKLGRATDTEDATGHVIEEKKVQGVLNRQDIERVFNSFKGVIQQVPPMYSAVKVNGKKLYEYARAGMTVTRPVREVTIYELRIHGNQSVFESEIPFDVKCSKGTYVRTLAVDIGRKCGYPAHLETLTRTSAGPFQVNDCFTFEEIEQAVQENRFSECLSTISYALQYMPSLVVDKNLEEKILNGAVLPLKTQEGMSPFAVFNQEGDCLAIYQKHPDKEGLMKPVKVLLIKEDDRR
ncbi:tRNA pseudouridine(55) synthase TruB [Terrilactibacillus sp. BCM23-1]|uniref:tRNA pseudouridine synthase B n=1 Tax=Terrilactibacillus tamarindi TaxID=2599694 RepID=A0A6N8CQ30_9BACI|nr:tRNA pseudouridine(55) synthase TruB [Terrilactibacillus tamarindi]MTT32234.1 tRNA pseudouridine(55) synthase TruB [Terrilactibacillus tamarindi]